MQDRSQRIDALRGLAISGVILYHYVYTMGVFDWLALPSPVSALFANGWAGVDLFFVLSAFLLTRNLLRKADEPGIWLTFYWRRVLRIMPAFLVLLGLGYALRAVWVGVSGDPDVWLWKGLYPGWTYLLFLQNIQAGLDNSWAGQIFAPTWSLATEEHFYLVLPLLVTALPRRGLAILAAIWIVSAPVIRLGLQHEFGNVAAYSWTIARFDAFGWGMLIALLPSLAPKALDLLSPRLCGIAAILGFAVFALLHRPNDLGADPIFGLTAMALIAAAAVYAVAYGRAEQTRWPIGAFAWAGERCFSLYLLHMPVLGLTFLAFGVAVPHGTTPAGLVAIGLAATLLIAAARLSYRYIEYPFMALANQRTDYAPIAKAA